MTSMIEEIVDLAVNGEQFLSVPNNTG